MLVEELQATIEREMDKARNEGRSAEIRLMRAYVDRAEAALNELDDRLEPAEAADIRAECDEARAWLNSAET